MKNDISAVNREIAKVAQEIIDVHEKIVDIHDEIKETSSKLNSIYLNPTTAGEGGDFARHAQFLRDTLGHLRTKEDKLRAKEDKLRAKEVKLRKKELLLLNHHQPEKIQPLSPAKTIDIVNTGTDLLS